VIALANAKPGDSLLPAAVRPRVVRLGLESDLVPIGDGTALLLRDVPAGTAWSASIRGPSRFRVVAGGFPLLPGGHALLEVSAAE
jgi:hypothetical protein